MQGCTAIYLFIFGNFDAFEVKSFFAFPTFKNLVGYSIFINFMAFK